MRFTCLYLLLILTSPGAATAAIKKPLKFIDFPHTSPKGEVLIYYANETAPDALEYKNYQTIISWLNTSHDKEAEKVASQLKSDSTEFQSSVDEEVEEIKRAFQLKNISTGQVAGAVIFTNRLSREGHFLILTPGMNGLSTGDLLRPRSDNIIEDSNPLATAAGLKMALSRAAATFDPHKYWFILVTKSHGAKELALTPRLSVIANGTNQKELIEILNNEDTITHPLPNWIKHRLGTSKERYFELLEEAYSEYGMQFPIVFMESCESSIEKLDNEKRLSLNSVGLLFSTEGSTPYRLLNYSILLNHFDENESLHEKFKNYLSHNQSKRTSAQKALYFSPLLCVFILFLIYRKREI